MKSTTLTTGICLVTWLGACAAGEVADPAPVQPEALRGVCYSPFRVNQNPDCGVLPSEAQIREDLTFLGLSGISRRIRTYSCAGSLGAIPAIANDLDIECWPGAWLSRYRGPTERELEALIVVGRKKLRNCPALIVGNEVLLRGDLSEDALLAAIMRVREQTGLPVAYAEIGAVWEKHPRVAEAVDVMLVHLYPFWESSPIDGAVDRLVASLDRLASRYPGKRLVVGETGWPSAGEAMGAARPTPEHQARYLKEFLAASLARDIDYFYFSLFSEAWKSATAEGVRGGHWGICAAEGMLNPECRALVPEAAHGGIKRAPGAVPKPAALQLPAFVYREGDADENRFRPTNWMGDIEDLTLDEYCQTRPRSGAECLKITYTPAGWNRWAGIYFIGPYMNHWGDYPGYSLKGARKLVFWARGERGGERVEFKCGGMNSGGKSFRDSFGPLASTRFSETLAAEWREYSIDLTNADTSSLLGGFCFALNTPGNPRGCTFYLDDVVLVAEVVPPPLPRPQTAPAASADTLPLPPTRSPISARQPPPPTAASACSSPRPFAT